MTILPSLLSGPAAGAPSRARFRALEAGLHVVLGACLVALAARIAVPLPFSPVPMTLQGLAVIVVGGLLGPGYGAAAMVAYLLAGVAGLPVFAPGGLPGLARLVGPTGGYLLAFPVAAEIAGRIAVRGRWWPCLAGALGAMLTIHAGGWALLAIVTGSPGTAAAMGITPFLIQDLLKALLAAVVLRLGHRTLRLTP